ncbi:MAG: hypothetical protein M1377_08485, partial [Deltaproteobacteria bacterium]|nr:hypothetical protein [Deltaproteobacteria bacterium]
GLKTPTGSTRETDNGGDRFDAEFQPGSGSWDPLVGLAAGRRWDSASLDASILYTIATKGAQETDLGDILHFGAAVSRRFAPAGHGSHAPSTSHGHGPEVRHSHLEWDFILEATGEWKRKQTVLGVKDGDSGGTLVLLSPGVRLNFYERWSAYLSAGIPVLQDLNGTQHETRYRVILGISVGL